MSDLPYHFNSNESAFYCFHGNEKDTCPEYPCCIPPCPKHADECNKNCLDRILPQIQLCKHGWEQETCLPCNSEEALQRRFDDDEPVTETCQLCLFSFERSKHEKRDDSHFVACQPCRDSVMGPEQPGETKWDPFMIPCLLCGKKFEETNEEGPDLCSACLNGDQSFTSSMTPLDRSYHLDSDADSCHSF